MPIGKSYVVNTVKSEIEKVLDSKMDEISKKREIGSMLFKLAQKYGNDTSNQLVEDYNLSLLKIEKAKV